MRPGFSDIAAARAGGAAVDHSSIWVYRDETDFQRFLSECPGVLETAQFVAVEAAWRPESVYIEPRPSGQGIFQRAELRWLTDRDKLVLPCDIDWPIDPALSGGALRQMLEDHFMFCLDINRMSHLDESWRNRWQRAGMHSYQNIREEMMLGQLGFWLHELDEAGELSAGHTELPFTVGGAHEPLVGRVRQFVGSEPIVYRTHEPSDSNRAFVASLREGYLVQAA